MREIYIIESLKKYRNFCLQVTSTPFQITYLQKHCFYLLSALEKPAIIFDRFFLSSCLVLVSRINSIRSIANRCSALSFLLFSTVFLRVYLALQSNQKRKGRMLSQMMLHGEYFNDLELKCFQSSCLAFSPALLPQSNYISKSGCHGCLPCWEVLYHMFIFLPVLLSALEASPTCSTQTNSFDHFSGVWDLRCCWYVSADTYLHYVNNLNLFLL